MRRFFEILTGSTNAFLIWLRGVWLLLAPLFLGVAGIFIVVLRVTNAALALVDESLAAASDVVTAAGAGAGAWNAFAQMLIGINTFVPLDWMAAAGASYGSLVVTAAVVRIVKSFIPTVSG